MSASFKWFVAVDMRQWRNQRTKGLSLKRVRLGTNFVAQNSHSFFEA